MKKTDFIESFISEYQDGLAALKEFYQKDRKSIDNYSLDKINDQIALCKRNSVFYKNYLKNIGVLNALHGIQNIPMVSKETIKHHNNELLTTDIKNILRYGETTGTSGKPLGAYIHRKNYIRNSISLAYMISHIFNSSDIVSISVPYELSFAGPDIDSAFQLLNSTIIATGSLSKVCPWEKTLDILYRLGVTSIVASPTRIIRLAMMAEEQGLNPKEDFALKKFFSTGESLSKAKSQVISNIWGASHICNSYGMTETNTLAVECDHGNLHALEDRYYFEVINPETLERVNDGEIGELVVTSLDNIAMPLIRYRTGDMVIKGNTCECGLITSTIKHLGRKNDVLKIGKVTIPVVELEEALYVIENIGYTAMLEQEGPALNIYLEVETNELNNIKDQFIENLKSSYHGTIDYSNIRVRKKMREEFISLIDTALKPVNALIKR